MDKGEEGCPGPTRGTYTCMNMKYWHCLITNSITLHDNTVRQFYQPNNSSINDIRCHSSLLTMHTFSVICLTCYNSNPFIATATRQIADLYVSKAALTICIKTSCTCVMSQVNVLFDAAKVNRIFDQLVILWTAGNTTQQHCQPSENACV